MFYIKLKAKKLVLIKQGLINTIVIIHKNSFKGSE